MPSPTPTPELQQQLYTAAQLQANPTLITSIVELLNAAFSHSRLDDPETWAAEALRFPHPERFIDMLGDEGICAVILAKEEGDEGTWSRVVATASATPWRGPRENLKPHDLKRRHLKDAQFQWREDWELKTVASVPPAIAPGYRNMGLASRCCKMVEDVLIGRANGIREQGKGEARLRLWILMEEERNGPYWRRRGFVTVERRMSVVGEWGCKKPFVIGCMVREVDLGSLKGMNIEKSVEREGKAVMVNS
ncbi:hypothetical protein K432DRAFT_380490 [Lepidopterella palustris CBS 459.81]|uniref:N-acetyltransferase domain-containing protein n=1 Tax=Lepidopterella palustris CBS 459.81 TaxID=1314670 RepID=A0A8E2EEL2_9PEZI|nr:hypothetical protein K432DRAFT_380490 [Lepidopterella palustris CBS 459.81]